ncbi:MAG: K(+)-transporting ATPase subunit C [Spirosomataceae bacterium]
MKLHLFPALKLTLLLLVLVSFVYPSIVWLIAQLTPSKGQVAWVMHQGQPVGAALVGQSFTQDRYFWSRPSAVAYNAAASGGSNKAGSNPDYQHVVQARLDTFLVHNPSVKPADVPAELLTASGSGLDPDLSPQGALVQVPRIAKTRHLSENQLKDLVERHVQKPLLGLFGTEKVNVLALNLALDQL